MRPCVRQRDGVVAARVIARYALLHYVYCSLQRGARRYLTNTRIVADVGGAQITSAIGHDPLGVLWCIGGLYACLLGLLTTLFARLCVSPGTESTRRRGCLLLMLAFCGVASGMSATANIIWLALKSRGLSSSPILLAMWETVLMASASGWASRLFVVVDAGRWGGDDADAAASRVERVLMMNPAAAARTTAPVGQVEHLLSSAQTGSGDR